MKSKITNLILTLSSISFIFGFFVVILVLLNINKIPENSLNYDERVKPGQVWIKTDSIDPFESIEVDTIQVIDVKKDYALILFKQDTISVPSKFVTIDSKQIK